MANPDVKFFISADASQLSVVTKRAEGQFKGFCANIKSSWLGVTAAIAGAMITIQKAWSLAEMAAAYNEQTGLLNNLAGTYGTTAKSIIEDMKKASGSMISMADMTQVAVEGLQKGLSPDMMRGLSEAAAVLSDYMGTTAADALKKLAEGLELNKVKTLKLAIGTIDLKEKYGDLAEKMSEAEKQTAFYKLIMEESHRLQKLNAGSAQTTADKMEVLTSTLKDLQLVMGQGLLRAGAGLYGTFLYLKSGVLGLTADVYALIAAYHSLGEANFFLNKQERLKHTSLADEASKKSIDLWIERDKAERESKEYLAAMTASVEDFQLAIGGNRRMPSPGGPGAAGEITNWKDELNKLNAGYAKADAALIDKMRKDAEDFAERLNQDLMTTRENWDRFQQDLTRMGATETEKRMMQVDDWVQDMRARLFDAGVDYETYQAMLTQVLIAAEKQRAAIITDEEQKAWEDWLDSIKENAIEIHESLERITSGMTGAFEDFFDYTSKGFMDFGQLAKRILHDIYQQLIDVLIVKQLVGSWDSSTGTGTGLIGFIGAIAGAFAGGGGAPAGSFASMHPTVNIPYHQGGYVPRFHFGGLSSDERPAILQTGEYVMSRRGVAALDQINSGNVGGNETHNYYYIQATDAKSFSDMVERNPGAIQKIMQDDERRGGPLWRRR